MQLVILAAGHGRRFGGLKQLAPVGPNGEAIMDYTALAAEACGFQGVVLVVREEIRDEVADHVRRRWTGVLPVEFVCQPPLPGTAQALMCARPAVHGPFGVANADDLYGEAALRLIAQHFTASGEVADGSAAANDRAKKVAERHLLVAYHLMRTVLTEAPVTRGLCHVGADRLLDRVAEHRVHLCEDGSFDAIPLERATKLGHDSAGGADHVRLSGDELVSMNLWGFHPRLFDELEDAIANFDPRTAVRPELLLPDVVAAIVASGRDLVQVVETSNRCIGITHREDTAIVRDEVAHEHEHLATLRSAER